MAEAIIAGYGYFWPHPGFPIAAMGAIKTLAQKILEEAGMSLNSATLPLWMRGDFGSDLTKFGTRKLVKACINECRTADPQRHDGICKMTLHAGVSSSGPDILQELTAVGIGIRTFHEKLGFDISIGMMRLGLAHIGRQQNSQQEVVLSMKAEAQQTGTSELAD